MLASVARKGEPTSTSVMLIPVVLTPSDSEMPIVLKQVGVRLQEAPAKSSVIVALKGGIADAGVMSTVTPAGTFVAVRLTGVVPIVEFEGSTTAVHTLTHAWHPGGSGGTGPA